MSSGCNYLCEEAVKNIDFFKNAYVNNVSTISEQIKRKATTIRDSNTW